MLLYSVKFHVYHACLQDILAVLKCLLSFEGQERGAVAARVAVGLQNVVKKLKELQLDPSPYERFTHTSITVKDGKPYKGDWELDKEGSRKAVSTKHAFTRALLQQLMERFENPAYKYFVVVDFRSWKTKRCYKSRNDLCVVHTDSMVWCCTSTCGCPPALSYGECGVFRFFSRETSQNDSRG